MPGPGENVASDIPADKVQAMRQQGMSNDQIIQTLQREGYGTTNIFNAMSQASMKAEVDMGSSMPQEGPQAPAEFEAPALGPEPAGQPAEAPAAEETPFYMQEQGAPGAPGPMPGPEEMPPAMPEQLPGQMPAAMPTGSPPGAMPTYGPSPETQRIEELAEAIIDEKWNEIVRSINKIIDWKERVESRITKLEQTIVDMRKEFDSLHKGVLGKIGEYDKSLTDVGTEIQAMEKVFKKVLPTLTENVNELSRIKDNLKK